MILIRQLMLLLLVGQAFCGNNPSGSGERRCSFSINLAEVSSLYQESQSTSPSRKRVITPRRNDQGDTILLDPKMSLPKSPKSSGAFTVSPRKKSMPEPKKNSPRTPRNDEVNYVNTNNNNNNNNNSNNNNNNTNSRGKNLKKTSSENVWAEIRQAFYSELLKENQKRLSKLSKKYQALEQNNIELLKEFEELGIKRVEIKKRYKEAKSRCDSVLQNRPLGPESRMKLESMQNDLKKYKEKHNDKLDLNKKLIIDQLEEWNVIGNEIKELERRCESYKKIIAESQQILSNLMAEYSELETNFEASTNNLDS